MECLAILSPASARCIRSSLRFRPWGNSKSHQTAYMRLTTIVLFNYTILNETLQKMQKRKIYLSQPASLSTRTRDVPSECARSFHAPSPDTSDWIRTISNVHSVWILFYWLSIGGFFCAVLCLPQENWLWIFIFLYFGRQWSFFLFWLHKIYFSSKHRSR